MRNNQIMVEEKKLYIISTEFMMVYKYYKMTHFFWNQMNK
jgi:hypothetical protein